MTVVFRFVFPILFLISPGLVLGQKGSSKSIPWAEEYKLVWDDFEAKPRKSHFASALSDITFVVNIESENNDLIVFIQTSFNPEGSWVKEDAKNDYLLRHEQSHFDLYEVNARKMRKELQAKVITTANAQTTVSNLMEKYSKLNEESQNRYDEETSHSLKEKNQEIWNERIARDLMELKDYSSPSFRIPVKN